MDDDNRIRVYDPEQPDPVRTLSMPVPAASVWYMCLSEDNAYIAIGTADNQLGILDAESGEVKYWEFIQLGENELLDSPALYTDRENQRLYVAFSGGRFPGKCIDLRSWQKLQDVEGLIAFCPETGKVLQVQNDWGVLKTVPTTLELVNAAKAILEGI